MSEAGSLEADELIAWLESERAHHDLIHWVKSNALAWPAAWEVCPRGDWLLALAHRAGAERADLCRAALALAALVEEEVEDPGVSSALERLRKSFAMQDLSPDFVAELDEEADRAPDLALAHAYRILSLVGRSHDDPEAVALVPTYLVELSMVGTGDCAWTSVIAATQRRTADIVRRELATPGLQRASDRTSSSAPDGTQ